MLLLVAVAYYVVPVYVVVHKLLVTACLLPPSTDLRGKGSSEHGEKSGEPVANDSRQKSPSFPFNSEIGKAAFLHHHPQTHRHESAASRRKRVLPATRGPEASGWRRPRPSAPANPDRGKASSGGSSKRGREKDHFTNHVLPPHLLFQFGRLGCGTAFNSAPLPSKNLFCILRVLANMLDCSFKPTSGSAFVRGQPLWPLFLTSRPRQPSTGF